MTTTTDAMLTLGRLADMIEKHNLQPMNGVDAVLMYFPNNWKRSLHGGIFRAKQKNDASVLALIDELSTSALPSKPTNQEQMSFVWGWRGN